jgi:hypothetical protein
MLLAPPLVRVTLLFGPAEYFWVAAIGLASVSVLLGKDPVKGLIAACIGLLIGTVGIDSVSGHERFTFDDMVPRPRHPPARASRIAACACGLRRIAMWATPGIARSSV